MFILLRKEDFFYECAEDLPENFLDENGFYDYRHAFFTLDGDVLSLNKKNAPVSYLFLSNKQLSKQETFRKGNWNGH